MDANPVKRSGKKEEVTDRLEKSGDCNPRFTDPASDGFSDLSSTAIIPDRKFSVEILVDGYPSQRHSRRRLRSTSSLSKASATDVMASSVRSDDAILNESAFVEARLANVGTAVGTPIAARPAIRRRAAYRIRGQCAGSEACVFRAGLPTQLQPRKVLVDGTPISRVKPRHGAMSALRQRRRVLSAPSISTCRKSLRTAWFISSP